ncbi:exported hypothetical protein [Tenacibaculum litopenaei]|uniref:hypothetical protein n=1 Tax=Tenacibaculum litopenaei TaxID=396016 RepID=UPI0038933CCF
MKKSVLFMCLAVVGTVIYANNMNVEQPEEVLLNDDCGGCIAWADSRDDGSDRTLKKWQKDLDDCRASSSECQE